MSYTPIIMKSGDSGAPTLSGTAGDLLTVLNACLTCRAMYTAVSGGSFVDNTTEARGNVSGQTAFKLFQGPTASNDEAYFGLTARFDRLFLNFGTLGVQASAVTLAWEYWDGAAWSALTVADGTSGLTANGVVTWTTPSNWATKSVNSLTCYWVRVRFTAGSWTTNPLVNYSSLTGWVKPFADSGNVGSYQSLGGVNIYLSVNDNAPANARNARWQGFETMSALQTGSGPFPTAEAAANSVRKSQTADATTRTWMVYADDRTFYVFVLTNDEANTYVVAMFGDFYSYVVNDNYRNVIIGSTAETAGTLTSFQSVQVTAGSMTTTITGHNLQRLYTGLGGGGACGKHQDNAKCGAATVIGAIRTNTAAVQFPNGADGGIVLSPIWLTEATNTLRGHLRGMWAICHADTSGALFTDGDTFSGSGAYAGRTFYVVKNVGAGNGTGQSVLALETSNTLDTN